MANYRYKVCKGQKVVAVSTTLHEAEAEAKRIGGIVLRVGVQNPPSKGYDTYLGGGAFSKAYARKPPVKKFRDQFGNEYDLDAGNQAVEAITKRGGMNDYSLYDAMKTAIVLARKKLAKAPEALKYLPEIVPVRLDNEPPDALAYLRGEQGAREYVYAMPVYDQLRARMQTGEPTPPLALALYQLVNRNVTGRGSLREAASLFADEIANEEKQGRLVSPVLEQVKAEEPHIVKVLNTLHNVIVGMGCGRIGESYYGSDLHSGNFALKGDQLILLDPAACDLPQDALDELWYQNGWAKRPAVQNPAPAADQTKTAAFKKWFGKSKVVDKDGKPLVVYHGTNRKIHVFDPNVGINAPVPKSVYFSDDPNIASWVAKNRGSWEEGGKVIAAYLRIENPLVIDANGAHAIHLTDQVASLLRRDHDGVIIKNVREFFGDEWTTTFAVFSPTQIKSATGNRGTFDPHDPDIRNPAPAADQTKTAAFKRWFGKSKVVDKDGKPLVVYHGTRDGGFTKFDKRKIDAHHHGFFFTDSKEMASSYAHGLQADVLADLVPFATRKDLDAAIDATSAGYVEVPETKLAIYRLKYAKELDPRIPKAMVEKVFEEFDARSAWASSSKMPDKLKALAKQTVALVRAQDAALNSRWSTVLGRVGGKSLPAEVLSHPVAKVGTLYGIEDRDDAFAPKRRWFASDRGFMESLLGFLASGKVGIYSVYLSFQNPFEIDAQGAQWDEIPLATVRGALTQSQLAKAHAKGVRWAAPKAQRSYLHSTLNTDAVCNVAKLVGYDSVIIRNLVDYGGGAAEVLPADVFIAFEPTQIKSATANKGTFSRTDPDIRNPAPAADQTKSAAFKKWFGKSKVVKGGKPLVVYHGSPEYGFKVFDLEKIDAHHVGFFFTDKRDMANTYAEGKPGQRPKRSGIYEVYLRIEEPFEVDAKGAIWDNIPLEYEDWDGTVVEERASTITISRTARDLGHDGCIIHNVYDGWGDQRGDVFVVFNPNQVKSVDNRGTFSRYDDNIRNPAERTFIPPPAVAAEARKALDLRAKQPPSNRCCTPVGIARAKQLANRQPVSETTLRRMKAYFDRHAVDAKGKGWGVDSKGWQAWLAWGGTSGRKWCENILRSL